MFHPGESIGNYRVLAKIGTGGMGAVYLAEHPLIGKKIALKVIHRELSGNKEVVQRFFQEARSVNKIGNEHIVEIHDFGVTDNGDHFYIMEYLDGQTLAAVLAREHRLEVMRALHIGSQIASALAATHAAGIIHRDLKPDNIMLMKRLGDPDFVKVLDFGLAKVLTANSAVKTAAGVLLGTPQYMSPEACESKREIDHRTDIYALGILLFQMMTGVLPFDGESMGEVLVKQVTVLPPAPRGFNPAIPPSVEQVLLRCLAKPPDARFPTMLALRDALLDPEAYLRQSPPISPARSVAPGEAKVDAKTVMAHVAAASQQKTTIGTAAAGGMLPLPPPQVSQANMQATVMADSLVAPRKSAQVPALASPNEPKNNTMRIATPLGYSSRPPRKMWPVVLVLGLLLGLGGGAFAVAWFGRDEARSGSSDQGSSGSSGGSGSASSGSGSASSGSASSGSASSGSGAGSAAMSKTGTKPASLTIETIPAGVEVVGPDHKVLGKTPLSLDWPVSKDPVTFELRAPGYKKKTKQLVVGGNTAVHVELERLPIQVQTGQTVKTGTNASGKSGTGQTGQTGKGSGGSHDGLMKPDD